MSEDGDIECLLRVVFGLFAALFVWAAYLQLNDTQPVLWIAIYGIAAGFCVLGAARVRLPPLVAFGYTAAVVAGAGYLAWRIFGAGDVTAMYDDGLADDAGLLATKEGREMLGLVIAAVVCGGYGYWSS